MKKYNCPIDCDFLLNTSGPWDNPQMGGCAVTERFSVNTTFEKDDTLIICPFYMRPLDELIVDAKATIKRIEDIIT